MMVAAQAIRDRHARETNEPEKSRSLVVIVPHFSETMAEPDEAKLALFRENLDELIHAAFEDPEKDSDWPERYRELPEPAKKSELPILDQACAACRGKCCREGSCHAYLNHFPWKSLAGACVYHTDRGCNRMIDGRSLKYEMNNDCRQRRG